MHIAVLFYGRLDKCEDHYTNIIDRIGKDNTLDIFVSSDNSPDNLLQKCIQKYNPVSYNNDEIIYNGKLVEYIGNIDGVNVYNMIRHFINKHRVFTLLEQHIEKTNTQYNYVLCLRFDLRFHNNIPFNGINDNTVYIPHGVDWLGGLNDQLAFGNVSSMKKYMNIWCNTETIIERGLSRLHPENITLANVNYTGLHVSRFSLSYDISK
jgi:hypothetical protein